MPPMPHALLPSAPTMSADEMAGVRGVDAREWAFHGVIILPAATAATEADVWTSEWSRGPLPIPLSSGRDTTAEVRATYFDARATRVLYGPCGVRQHRCIRPVRIGSLQIDALEVLRRDGLDWAILHWAAAAEPMTTVSTLTSLEDGRADVSQLREVIAEHAPGVLAIERRLRRGFAITFEEGRADAQDEDGRRRRMFHLASATTERSFPLTAAQVRRLADQQVLLSEDWSAVVLRDGAAFLTTTTRGERPFLHDGLVHVRSIYVDAMLMGLCQMDGIHALVDAVSELDDPASDLDGLLQLEQRFAQFRNQLWWQHLTKHGTANELLRIYHQQHRLPALVGQVADELRDYARQAELRRAVDAREVAEREEERDRRLSTVVALVGAIAVPPTIASGVLDVLQAEGLAERSIGVGVWVLLLVAGLAWWRRWSRERVDDMDRSSRRPSH